MQNNQLAQYYNEQFKQPQDPSFETLTEAEVIRLEKALKSSFGFWSYQNRLAIQEFRNAINEQLSKIGFKLR